MLTVKREHELDKLFATIKDYLPDDIFETYGTEMTDFCCEIAEEAYADGKDAGIMDGYDEGYSVGFDDGSKSE